MRKLTFLATIGALLVSIGAPPVDGRLVGCPDPAAIAAALAKLRQLNWQEVSLVEVQPLWPVHVYPVECEPRDGCTLASTNGRIINGKCQCCESFTFVLSEQKDGSRRGQLRSVVIFYSAPQRNQVLAAAKKLARATGLPESDVKSVGDDEWQHFQWMDASEKELFVVEIEITHKGSLWTLDMAFGRESLIP